MNKSAGTVPAGTARQAGDRERYSVTTEIWCSMMFSIESARQLLQTADVFFGADDDEDHKGAQTLNLNDAFVWACADGEYVEDAELPRVAELFWKYGYCGILYWASLKTPDMRIEFRDVSRFVEFVANEEAIVAEEPQSTKRAYLQRDYHLGKQVASPVVQ